MPAPHEPCPLPVDAVQAARAPFGSSALLPQAAYVDPGVFAWEQRRFFAAGWVCVGRVGELAESSTQTQHAVPVGGSSVLLVRGRDGELRVFANLCRHRGHELLACGATSTRGVVHCPYHAWSYGLDGALRAAPGLTRAGSTAQGGTAQNVAAPGDGAGGPTRADLALIPVRHVEWAGWLFVDLDGTAPDFHEHAGGLIDLVAPWAPADLVPAVTNRYELAANWKLVAENYHECLHCPPIHPQLCRVTVPTSGDNVRHVPGAFVGGTMGLEGRAATMSMTGQLAGTVRPGLDAAQRRQVVYLHLFPNLLISLHPDYVMTHRLQPLAADRTLIECQWLFDPADVARADFDPSGAVGLWDITNRQDWAAVESVQRGIASPLYRPGVLAHHEDAVYQFVSMVAGGYLGLPLRRGEIDADYRR